MLKSVDPSDTSIYEPFFILIYVTKIFELIVYTCIKTSLKLIIHINQFGYHVVISSITRCVVFISYILENHKVSYQIDTIYINIKKAFDFVNYGLLIHVLYNHGIGTLCSLN